MRGSGSNAQGLLVEGEFEARDVDHDPVAAQESHADVPQSRLVRQDSPGVEDERGRWRGELHSAQGQGAQDAPSPKGRTAQSFDARPGVEQDARRKTELDALAQLDALLYDTSIPSAANGKRSDFLNDGTIQNGQSPRGTRSVDIRRGWVGINKLPIDWNLN